MNNRGFTLIELIISISIIALLMFIAAIAWSSLSARSRVEDAQTRVVSLLREAREKTLATVGGTAWGVRLENTQITLFPGASFVAGLASSTVYAMPSGARVGSWSLSGGGADVLFLPLSGETRQDGVIILQRANDASIEKRARIHQSGYVEEI